MKKLLHKKRRLFRAKQTASFLDFGRRPWAISLWIFRLGVRRLKRVDHHLASSGHHVRWSVRSATGPDVSARVGLRGCQGGRKSPRIFCSFVSSLADVVTAAFLQVGSRRGMEKMQLTVVWCSDADVGMTDSSANMLFQYWWFSLSSCFSGWEEAFSIVTRLATIDAIFKFSVFYLHIFLVSWISPTHGLL